MKALNTRYKGVFACMTLYVFIMNYIQFQVFMRKTLKSLFKRGPIGYKLFQGQIPVAVHFLSALSASISVSLSLSTAESFYPMQSSPRSVSARDANCLITYFQSLICA